MHLDTLEPPVLARIAGAACRDEELALATEWLETDGRGGYAASTPWMCPTRRYHGLLVVRPTEGARRHLFLARFEEELSLGSKILPLSVARYGTVLHPRGHEELEEFELRPQPSALYRHGRLTVRREVCLARRAQAVLVRYEIQGTRPGERLLLRPLFAFREADALTHENSTLDPLVRQDEKGFLFQPYPDLPPVAITIGAASHTFQPAPMWYRGITYSEDARRGYDSIEDQFSPGQISIPLEVGGEIVIAAALHHHVHDPRALFDRERRERVAHATRAGSSRLGRASLAADDFLYRTGGGRLGVQAGYPWFEEWGRDTFVSLPGLTLARGDLASCAEVLSGALPFLRDGLLPNIFGRTAEDSTYDSADAALWFARAVGLYRRAGGARERLLDEYWPALEAISEAYAEGTSLGMHATRDGLLWAGSPERNATWMDARTSDGPVTPRAGCAVELEALWYALLDELEVLGLLAGDERAQASARKRKLAAGRAFLEHFWLADERRLADVWDGERADRAVRPNMVIAAALEASPLERAMRAGVVECAERELLTPCGLRTLSPADPAYIGRFEGGPTERDRAYHQGTAWPWLTGFYVEAVLRAARDPRAVRAPLGALLLALAEEQDRACLGHLSEVFDGDAPQRPGGTFAQAWNAGELLRAHALLAEIAD